MKVKISAKSAASCLLLPSPINLPKKKSAEALVPLPLQHRTVRRRWLQRRRFRTKAMIRPIISSETTTEDEIPETNTKEKSNRQFWNLAPELSTDDAEQNDATTDLSGTNNRKRRSADEQANVMETKIAGEVSEPKAASGIAGKISVLLEVSGKKKRLHGDVASLVSPMRSSKRQRFSFSA